MLERSDVKIFDKGITMRLGNPKERWMTIQLRAACVTAIPAALLALTACASHEDPALLQAQQAEWNALQAATQAFNARDYKTAFEGYMPWAEKGDHFAEQRIGYMYLLGLGVQQDEGKARSWYEKAALDGNAPAAIDLGYDYMVPESGAPDYGQALKWFTVASDHGNLDADLDISILYEHGLGVPKDHDQALHWLNEFVARQQTQGDKIHYRFTKFTSGDNTGGFGVALQWVLKQASDHRDVPRCDCRFTGLTFHYQDGRATDVTVTTPSGDAAADAAAVDFLLKTLLPPVLPSLSHQDRFAVYVET